MILPANEFTLFFELNEKNTTLLTSFIAIDKIEFTKGVVTNTGLLEPIVKNVGNLNGNKTIAPLNGKWTDWSEWSRCVGTCHSSVQYRTRICLTRPTRKCAGKNSDLRACPNSCKSKRDSSSFSEISSMLKNVSKTHIDVAVLNEPNNLPVCGGLYELGSSGMRYITSPNFLYQYPRAIECSYLIKVCFCDHIYLLFYSIGEFLNLAFALSLR